MGIISKPVYRCPYTKTIAEDQWQSVLRAEIAHFPWDDPANSYKPEAWGQVAWDDTGLTVRLFCRERNPRAVYTKPNDPVYKDSCLEFFVKAEEGASYCNFELNAKAALLAGRGEPGNRTRILEEGQAVFQARPLSLEDGWGVELRVPFQVLGVGERADRSNPPRLRCNFYKCGDDTSIPHYGCWSPIDNLTPQFHLPEFFGQLELVDVE